MSLRMSLKAFRRPRNVVLGVAVLLAVALLTPSINLGRFRRRVATALEAALGRKVEVGGVHIELLPFPALVAENVVVGERPEIGAEPVARMSELRATPRLRSLWTGRADFSSVVFVEPSVNLARAHFAPSETSTNRQTGVVTLTSSSVGAGLLPTEFPYIEVRDGRINFKRDDLKSVFFFSDVEAALYRENGGLYLRFRGRPARTDRALTGAGEVRVEGQILPRFDLQARLVDAFLNDLLALASGADPGIQGQFGADLRITGRPAALRMEGRASIADLHRGDFLPPIASAPLQVSFTASADLPGRRIDIAQVRSEAGTIVAFGGVRGFLQSEPRPLDWDLQLRLDGADGGRWFTALQRVSPRLSGDLQVSGTCDGKIHFMSGNDGPSADGEITVEDLSVRAGDGPPLTAPGAKLEFDGPMVRLEPVAIAAPGQRPVTIGLALDWTTPIRGPRLLQVSAAGQHLSLALFSRVAGALGWPGWPSEGDVSINAKATTERGTPPVFSGSVSFSKALWTPPWLAQPVRLDNLRLELAQRRVRATGLVAQMGESMITGSAERSVDAAGKPRWQADLHASDLSTAGLAALFAAQNPAPEWLSSLQVSGKAAANYFHLRGLLLEDVESSFTLIDRKLALRETSARLAGGRVTGPIDMNFTRSAPAYSARVKLTDVQTGTLAPDLAEGTISGSMDVKTEGRTASELADSLNIRASFQGRSLRLQSSALVESLRTDRTGAFAADVIIEDRTLRFTRLTLAGPPALEGIGTVSFDRGMDLDFRSFRLAGTLAEPRRVAPNELARKQEK
jgi:uncharacterized protein involved in outer membrane biogenesis